MNKEFSHTPVLYEEVLKYLSPKNGEVFIDATFGAGGYTYGILNAAQCQVLSLDRDNSVLPKAELIKKEFADRFHFAHSNFSDLDHQAVKHGFPQVDGIVFDLGVSSMQIDDAARGFSFMYNGPLDMRMDTTSGISAIDIVNTYSEKELADILYHFGDENKSFKIAKAIVERRTQQPIETTSELAEIIRRTIGHRNSKIDPATKSFQAIRIAVNDELNQLQNALHASVNLLKKGGRLVVVTFHSGEDTIVKKFFRDICGKVGRSNRHMPVLENKIEQPHFKELHKGVITATNLEVERNVRARSAKMRVILKL